MATFPRRSLFQLAGAAALLRTRVVSAQAPATGQPGAQQGAAPGQPGAAPARPAGGRGFSPMGGNPASFPELERRSNVAIMQGDDRRKNVYNALMAINDDLQPKLKQRKYVVIKPNFVNTQNQLAASHVDTMRGILDYLSEKFTGPVDKVKDQA